MVPSALVSFTTMSKETCSYQPEEIDIRFVDRKEWFSTLHQLHLDRTTQLLFENDPQKENILRAEIAYLSLVRKNACLAEADEVKVHYLLTEGTPTIAIDVAPEIGFLAIKRRQDEEHRHNS